MRETGTLLDEIVADKKAYLAEKKRQKPHAQLEKELAGLEPSEVPSFFDVLKADDPRPKIIAEIKRASPSAGVLREPFDIDEINRSYQSVDNVVAISIITEKAHFQGDERFLRHVARNNTRKKPLLRKDFLFEPYQILESKVLGAHAYLLIASLFDEKELAELVDYGIGLGLEPLVEVHTKAELDMARKAKARCIGANSRDLKTFRINYGVHGLLKNLDDSYARIAESGIETTEYLKDISSFSDAVLMGTEFMRSKDIAGTMRLYSVIAGTHL